MIVAEREREQFTLDKEVRKGLAIEVVFECPGSQTSFHKGSEVGMSLGCLRKRKSVWME